MLGPNRRPACHKAICPTSSISSLHHHHKHNYNRLAFSPSPSPVHASSSTSSTPTTTSSKPSISPYSQYVTPIPLNALTPMERAIHVFAATTTNLINGFIFGGLFGFVSGAWSKRSIRGALSEAGGNGKSWAAISAVYAGLQTTSKVLRRKDDRYNAIVGACGSGAAFSIKNGPAAAAQGCVTFAALSYFLDSLTTSSIPPEQQTDEQLLKKK